MTRTTFSALLAALLLVALSACAPDGALPTVRPGLACGGGEGRRRPSESATHLADIPFYFGVPKSVITGAAQTAPPTRTRRSGTPRWRSSRSACA